MSANKKADRIWKTLQAEGYLVLKELRNRINQELQNRDCRAELCISSVQSRKGRERLTAFWSATQNS